MDACIMCHEFKSGARVEDTPVLRTLRKLKADFAPMQMIWGKPTGNTLVVCAECREKHVKRRKSYEGKVLLHAIIAGALLLFIVLLPILTGTFQLGSLLVGLLLTLLLMSLPLLDYVPPIMAGEQWPGTVEADAGKTEPMAPMDATSMTSAGAAQAASNGPAPDGSAPQADREMPAERKVGAGKARGKVRTTSRGRAAKAPARKSARRR